MSNHPTQQWLLKIRPEAKEVFDTFSEANKRTIFRLLKQLLEADAPYTLYFVESIKDKTLIVGNLRKFRVGDFRVFFVLEPYIPANNLTRYKGALIILYIKNRRDAYKD